MPACFVQDLIIQQYFYNSSAEAINAFFDIPPATLPRFKDFKGNWDLRSRRNAKFTLYLTEGRYIELNVSNSSRESMFHQKREGMKGFNEMEWDLVKEINQGNSVYALPDIKFADPGEYTVILSVKGVSLEQKLVIQSPEVH
jgi:hypothetical protein